MNWASLETGQVVQGVWVGPIGIDYDDVEYILELWRYRCAITGEKLGKPLGFARWDESKPSDVDNIIMVSANGLKSFLDKAGGRDLIPEAVRKRIEERLESTRL